MDTQSLTQAIHEKLQTVMDPETSADVLRMRLVQNLNVDEDGMVSYIFQPSSPLCPIAVTLAMNIIEAIKEVPGVSGQDIQVTGYLYADELNETLKSVL
ncbi:MAG: iron-sulfur cluster assembly protein [Anaerolineaceae bacterium]|jgi:metal-sulfur cluster biosynthetic enzyme|nr:iron-sulfur cluster assembly protein [Anaerolineaceae bacterium]